MKLSTVLAAVGLAVVTSACDETTTAPVQRSSCTSDDGSRKSIITDDGGDLTLTLSDKGTTKYTESHLHNANQQRIKSLIREGVTYCTTEKIPNDALTSATSTYNPILGEVGFSCTGANGQSASAAYFLKGPELTTSDNSKRDDIRRYIDAKAEALKFCGVVPGAP